VAEARYYTGLGVILGIDLRVGRLIRDQEEILAS
jgi:hypothetical protein